MADGDAPPSAFASAAGASPRSPAPPDTPSMQKKRQRGLVSRVWKGIFGGREDVEKLLQALSKEEEAVRSRLHRRARTSSQSAHNVLALAAALERYDLDPAAKAAAATVLASKLGADSGLSIFLGDESNRNTPLSKSNDATTGLRQRKAAHLSNGTGRIHASESLDSPNAYDGNEEGLTTNQRTVEHFRGPAGNDGGWIARVAALLVGEDPTRCYALICGNCHMHNGLARKEDFAFITYYCPHCNALNGSRQHEDHEIVSNSGKETPTSHSDGSIGHTSASLAKSGVGSPVKVGSRITYQLLKNYLQRVLSWVTCQLLKNYLQKILGRR